MAFNFKVDPVEKEPNPENKVEKLLKPEESSTIDVQVNSQKNNLLELTLVYLIGYH